MTINEPGILLNKLIAKQNILILGSGAREHSILKKLSISPKIGDLYIAPGK